MAEKYTLIRSGRRTVGLSLDRDGNVTVRAPYLYPKAAIEAFLSENAGWIAKQRRKLAAQKENAESSGPITAEELRRLAAALRSVLPEKLGRYAGLLGITYGKVTVRSQKTKWGSCSSKGNLNFNCLLMLAPEEVLDYVIVHELCHVRHMDHSREFWAEVASLDPRYKAHKKWLKDNGGALMRRMEEGSKLIDN